MKDCGRLTNCLGFESLPKVCQMAKNEEKFTFYMK
jgi:hypothetical protein